MTTNTKDKAFNAAYSLYNEDAISENEYETICKGLEEIESLQDRDNALEKLWEQLEDIPMNPDDECIEAPFLHFPVGTEREEIWHWFDERHSKGVAYLLYGGVEDYVPETKRLYKLSKLCFDCESHTCQYNHGGECRFALVHECKPRINEDDGCIDYDYQEGDA